MCQRPMILLFIVGVQIASLYAAPAAEPNDPVEFLKVKLDAAIAVLQDKTLDMPAKEAKIDKVIVPIFDFRLMSYLTLGKAQWSKMTDEQQSEFTKLFLLRLKDSYREKLQMYNDEKILYKQALYTNKLVVSIPTELVRQENNIDIVYKMRNQKGEGWKIYEVEVQGVSIIRTYKSQFDEMLKKGSIDELIEKLAQPQPEQSPPAASK